jgi:hypothetical protein
MVGTVILLLYFTSLLEVLMTKIVVPVEVASWPPNLRGYVTRMLELALCRLIEFHLRAEAVIFGEPERLRQMNFNSTGKLCSPSFGTTSVQPFE